MSQWAAQWNVDGSKSGRVYRVSQKHDGTFACSCPNWKFTGERDDCKHILRIRLKLANGENPIPFIGTAVSLVARNPGICACWPDGLGSNPHCVSCFPKKERSNVRQEEIRPKRRIRITN